MPSIKTTCDAVLSEAETAPQPFWNLARNLFMSSCAPKAKTRRARNRHQQTAWEKKPVHSLAGFDPPKGGEWRTPPFVRGDQQFTKTNLKTQETLK